MTGPGASRGGTTARSGRRGGSIGQDPASGRARGVGLMGVVEAIAAAAALVLILREVVPGVLQRNPSLGAPAALVVAIQARLRTGEINERGVEKKGRCPRSRCFWRVRPWSVSATGGRTEVEAMDR